MRTPERQAVALECLKLAAETNATYAVDIARGYYAFVTGTDLDDAKEKLSAVQKLVSPLPG